MLSGWDRALASFSPACRMLDSLLAHLFVDLCRSSASDSLALGLASIAPIVVDLSFFKLKGTHPHIFKTGVRSTNSKRPSLRDLAAYVLLTFLSDCIVFGIRNFVEGLHKRGALTERIPDDPGAEILLPLTMRHRYIYVPKFNMKYELRNNNYQTVAGLKRGGQSTLPRHLKWFYQLIGTTRASEEGEEVQGKPLSEKEAGQPHTVIATTRLSQRGLERYVWLTNRLTEGTFTLYHSNCHHWVDVFLSLLHKDKSSAVLKQVSLSSVALPFAVKAFLVTTVFFLRRNSFPPLKVKLFSQRIRFFTPMCVFLAVMTWSHILM